MRIIKRNARFDLTRKCQSKSSVLMKDFKAVNEFFLSTEIRLKSSNENSFQSREMKRTHHPFTTFQLLPTTKKKDVLSAFQDSNIIYQYLCHSDSLQVGHTSKGCRTGSNSMYQIASELDSFHKINQLFLILPIIRFSMTPPLVNSSWIINFGSFNTIVIDSLYFPLVDLL